jgi:NAD(P)-dependent dehydrogenase (short-subunit alcohol dehydrogenase family)
MVDQLREFSDLGGRVAIVTGGGGLLGKAHARALGAKGAKVVLGDLNFDAAKKVCAELSSDFGTELFLPLRLDVTSPASIEDAKDTLLERYGAIDILINNAAIDAKVGDTGLLESSRFENFSLDQWHLEIEVGLTGAFNCSRIFGGRMAANGGGVILNIASDLSVIAPDQRLYAKDNLSPEQQPVKPVTYSVIKTGLIGLTRYLATYWADRNVRVNALSPGGVYVDQSEEFVRRLTDLIPMGRMANVDEYAGAVQFLCTDASRYMTGQNIVMDGGRSVL